MTFTKSDKSLYNIVVGMIVAEVITANRMIVSTFKAYRLLTAISM